MNRVRDWLKKIFMREDQPMARDDEWEDAKRRIRYLEARASIRRVGGQR